MTGVPSWWQDRAARWPRWEAWQGVNQLYYARIPRSSPPIVVRGESPQDLEDMIRKAESDLDKWRHAR
jgi:hypothetical protein